MFTLACKKSIILPPAFDETQPFKIIALEDNTSITFINGPDRFTCKNNNGETRTVGLPDSVTLEKTGDWIEITGYPAVTDLLSWETGICLMIDKDVKFEGNILSLNNFEYHIAQYMSFMKNNVNITNLPNLSHISQFEEHTFMNAFEGTGITEINENVFAKEITCDNDSLSFMFQNCTNLTKVILPDIKAKDEITMVDTAPLRSMFNGCTNLSYIKVGFKSWLDENHSDKTILTPNWVNGVAETGTFVCPKELEQIFDSSHIPPNWTVETY